MFVSSKILLFVFLCGALLPCILGKFVKLTDDNIEEKIAGGDWLILFDDASEHKAAEALWKELGEVAKGSPYRVGRVDCDKYPDACYDRKLKTKDLPKSYLYTSGDGNWEAFTFSDKSTAQQVLDSVTKLVHGDVEVLTTESFDSLVLGGGKPWLVEFFLRHCNSAVAVLCYAPWCGHCKQLAPTWKQLAADAKKSGDFEVGKVDATEHPDLGSRYGVQGYPTIKLFKDGEVIDYNGERTLPAFKNFVANPPPKEPEVEIEWVDETEQGEEKKDEL